MPYIICAASHYDLGMVLSIPATTTFGTQYVHYRGQVATCVVAGGVYTHVALVHPSTAHSARQMETPGVLGMCDPTISIRTTLMMRMPSPDGSSIYTYRPEAPLKGMLYVTFVMGLVFGCRRRMMMQFRRTVAEHSGGLNEPKSVIVERDVSDTPKMAPGHMQHQYIRIERASTVLYSHPSPASLLRVLVNGRNSNGEFLVTTSSWDWPRTKLRSKNYTLRGEATHAAFLMHQCCLTKYKESPGCHNPQQPKTGLRGRIPLNQCVEITFGRDRCSSQPQHGQQHIPSSASSYVLKWE
eukprot:m.508950 g.508950  ORF g.508950 m.508950 type:complete len:297 (-) comp21888_c2_seq4:1206-2096(-)